MHLKSLLQYTALTVAGFLFYFGILLIETTAPLWQGFSLAVVGAFGTGVCLYVLDAFKE